MKLSRSLILFALCLVLGGIAVPQARAQFFMFENPMVNKKAPDFTTQTILGGQQSLDQYRDGQKAIIFFWATWCPHCRKQLSELSNLMSNLEEGGVKIILVDLGEQPEQVKAYLQKNKIDHEVFLDERQEVAEQYGIIGVPTFYFVNKDGVIKAVEHEIPSNYAKFLDS